MLAITTYFIESIKILTITNILLAPIVFKTAKSKFFLYIPTFNILFIINTLKVNRLIIMSFKITPINIPK